MNWLDSEAKCSVTDGPVGQWKLFLLMDAQELNGNPTEKHIFIRTIEKNFLVKVFCGNRLQHA